MRSSRGARGLIAAVRLASVCTTILGMPVVPEVKRIHSVRRLPGGVAASGAIAGVQVTCSGTAGGRRSRVSSSETIASTPALAITMDRCSRGKSAGQRIIRRARPSSSISVSAVVS
jgi:hypothetical protein